MKKCFPAFIALMAVILFGSCASSQKSGANNDADLFRTWRLVELEGQAVDTTKLNRPAEFTFEQADQRVFGSAGCNSMTGKYKLEAPNKLTFSPMAGTRMACPDMSLETKFQEIIGKVNAWSVTEGFLVLSQDSTPLAKFIAK